MLTLGWAAFLWLVVDAQSAAIQVARAPSPCAVPVVRVDGTRAVGPGFSLRLPRGFEPVPGIQGIDSKVGQWSDGSGNLVAYDSGAAISPEYLRTRLADYAECRDTIAGFPVTMVSGRDTAGTMLTVQRTPKFVVVATWLAQPRGPIMSITAAGLGPQSLEHSVSILRSVRIP